MSNHAVNLDSLLGRRVGPLPLYPGSPLVTSWNGLTGDVVGTLASIWSYGKTHSPTTSNLFPFDSGNFRLEGSAASGATPAIAFYESAANPGDSRQGSHIQRRYYQTSIGVGGFTTDMHLGYDPTFDNVFTHVGGVQILTEWVGFTNGSGAESGAQSPMKFGDQTWWSVYGFFDGPDCFPTPGFNSGAREDVWFSLWSDIDQAVEQRVGLNGYGQVLQFIQPRNTGMTSALVSTVNANALPAAALNGIGWAVRFNGHSLPLPDPPVAEFGARMLTSDAAHGWQWAFWARDASNNIDIASPLATLDWVNGLVLNVPLSPASSNATQVYRTVGTIDFQTPNQFIDFDMPLIAGKSLIFYAMRIVMLTRDAALTTAPVFFLAQNGVDISGSVGPSTVTINTSPAPEHFAAAPAVAQLADMTNHVVQLHLTTAAAGAGLTTCTGYASIQAVYG